MTKRKRTKPTSNPKLLLYIAWGLALVALVLSSFVFGYYFGANNTKQELSKSQKSEKEKRLALIKKLEENSKQAIKEQKSVNERLQEVLKKETTNYVSASHEIDDDSLANPPKLPLTTISHTTSKPKLAIIIDDVGTESQVKAIKSLKLPLTMSFLPPSPRRPSTPRLASLESHYMVHLPMEAQNFSAEEPFTLRVHDSQEVITDRIKEIKKLFPKVTYINNHTGSKFTANEIAMNRLILALTSNKIHFIDSRTTAETKAPIVLKNFGLNYEARDVFLDHHMEKEYVLGQIKEAIRVAKEHGTAIAIGHPHKNTLQALYESKKLLKDVDLVYIDRL